MTIARGAIAATDRPAIDGGTPVRREMLPFTRATFGREEEVAVVETLRSGWIATGPRAERFEKALATVAGAEHGVAVGSCTAALHLLLRAAGVGPGDEVITSSMTFPATANAILHAGGTPVIADVLPDSLTLDPRAVEAAVTERTRVILPVHYAGWPCEMDELCEIAARHGAVVIEDAAHALGAEYRGRPAGSLGDGAAFSFYATKNITTGEGGMITTDRADWVEHLRTERLHGIDIDASQRDGEDYRHWEAVTLGWKYNLNDIAAAIGLAQLEKLPDILARRRKLDAAYREALAGQDVFVPVAGADHMLTAAHIFPLVLRPGALRLSRDQILQALIAERIGVGVHFRALAEHRYFRDVLGWRPEKTPVASSASTGLFSIPLYPDLTDAEQEEVLEALFRIARFHAA